MDEELAAIAELHSPVIDPGSVVAESESPRVDGLLESLHPLSEEMALTSPRRLRVDTRYATSSRTSPLSSTIFGPSPDLDQYDDVVSMNYLSPVAFHLPRPRQNSFRESDTPSLTSSASRSSLNSYVPSSFLGSPPASPPLNAQVHMPESSHLAAITELQPHGERYRSVEDEEEHKSPVLFSPVSEHPYNDSASTITPHKILARMRSNSDALRRLRTGTPPVDTAQEPLPSSAPSSSGPLQLTRFFSGKSDKPDEDKQRKAEEKRRRKEDAKARTENLALELKRRAEERARKAENASVYSTRSDEKRHRKAAWEEDGAAYSGLATGF
ncbi:hypothetical protein BV25DRAFT_1832377 [Artomyces pyxidatus]|uniref:Uncharacterized protein n=1 Tax=Artomyces pyxidatus TaxID=48021 RepID=A0ACB8SKF1_9AGAM|nr:hypothetical protein BV25DRAFT_1832377 [Artomyces pyxidatus]